jgi:hypothetical protein
MQLAVAKHTGSRLAIFPEYGLSSTNESSASFFELALPVGALACENGTADVPQQHFLSCASLRYGMTIAAQVGFTTGGPGHSQQEQGRASLLFLSSR